MERNNNENFITKLPKEPPQKLKEKTFPLDTNSNHKTNIHKENLHKVINCKIVQAKSDKQQTRTTVVIVKQLSSGTVRVVNENKSVNPFQT